MVEQKQFKNENVTNVLEACTALQAAQAREVRSGREVREVQEAGELRKERDGQMFTLGVSLLVALSLSSAFPFAVLADDDPQLRPDTPKLDTNIPKSTILKGGVKHEEQNQPAKQKLTGAANGGQAQSGLSHFKLFSSKAKADKQRALEAQARNSALNAQVASGIGIIGVKFVLAFGRPPVINRVFPGTPAALVGLRNNDVIVAVDGIPTYGLTKEEVYQMIVGSPGTPVTVTVSRNGDYVPRTMNRMDFNDITDPIVRRDYLMSI